MGATTLVLVAMAVLVLLGLLLGSAAGAYAKFRGKRLIVCPESGQHAAVDLAVWHVAWTAAARRPDLRLRHCSRWGDGLTCDQKCVRQIAAAPEECRVETILSRWYRDQRCSCCDRPIRKVDWKRRTPCVLSPELRIFEWKEIRPEKIPAVLGTHRPVCWHCLVAETHTW
jgi:hypothetical protein